MLHSVSRILLSKPLVRINRLKIIIVFLCSVLLYSSLSFAALTRSPKEVVQPSALSFDVCQSKTLGVEIGCLSSWEFIEGDSAVLLRIADYPETTVVIAKTNSSIAFLEQLTKRDLDKTARYANGFRLEPAFVDGAEALKVKAFSQHVIQSRVADYYFIQGGNLWGLFFSVRPKEEWDEVKFLFADLLESFHFIDQEVAISAEK